MTLTTDLVHDVISYLVAQCQASPALGLAIPPVAVFDGPTPPGEPLVQQQRVWIGFDALNGTAEAGTATQKWPFCGTSGGYRDEDGTITCTAEAWDGGLPIAVTRAQCKALVGTVENMLRGYPAAGGPGDTTMAGLVQWSQVEGPFTWTQSLDGSGSSAMCVFRVTYFARLAPS